MRTFNPADIFIRSPNLVATDMDGETVMLSIDRGEYFGLGGVGSRVWDLLAQPASIAQLVERIRTEFDVDETTCHSDIQQFTRDLFDNGLVTPA